MNNKINLVLASDQNYVKLLAPCIISILYNKKPTTEYNIYILESGISDFHKQKIKELEKFNNINNCTINFIDMAKEHPYLLKQPIKSLYWTAATIYMLAIPKLFAHLERVLCLDVDMIIKGDLLDLYNQNFEDNYCACVCWLPLTYKNTKLEDGSVIQEEYSLNSGVMLFNIPKIIADNKDKELLDFSLYSIRLPACPDQDILARVFNSKIKNIDEKYNTPVFDEDTLSRCSKEYKQELFTIFKDAIIIHYLYRIKPCNFKKLHKLNPYSVQAFFKYYQQSYLKFNFIQFKILWLTSAIKRLRRRLIGIKTIDNKKVLYIGKLQVKL
ncbi:glycosyltransferase family 8 protein [Rickettsiales bacterium LUAb2]